MKRRQWHAGQGFSLVEVVLALGVAAFCLVAIFGLLPVGINTNRTSIEQTVAANLASQVMADLQAIPKGYADSSPAPTSPRFKIPAPPRPGQAAVSHAFFLREDGTATALPDINANGSDNPRYRVTVTYTVPVTSQASFAVPTRVQITWPAIADATAASTPTNFSGSFELNSSLARN